MTSKGELIAEFLRDAIDMSAADGEPVQLSFTIAPDTEKEK